jgi:hypothetical protein
MEKLAIFSNDDFGEVRTIFENEEPMFCLTDACRVLDIKNVGNAKKRLSIKGIHNMDTLTNGGMQALDFINESNLYKLIFQSRKPKAEKFADWVTSEVLPAIRKTGSYGTSDKPENEKQIEDKQVEEKVSDEVLKKALKEEAEGKRYLDTIEGRLKYLEHLVFDMRYGEPGCYTRKLTERNKSGLKRRHGYTGNSWMERNKGKILKATVDYELKADDICSTIIRRCSEKYRLEDAVEIYCQEVGKYPEDTMDLIDYFPELAAIADKFLYSIR